MKTLWDFFGEERSRVCAGEVSVAVFWLLDDEEKKNEPVEILATNPDHKQALEVRNRASRPLHFLCVDKCLNMIDGQKCEALIYALQQGSRVWFIELKMGSKGNQHRDRLPEARNQILNTHSYFKTHNLLPEDRLKRGFIGIPSTPGGQPSTEVQELIDDYNDLYKAEGWLFDAGHRMDVSRP